MGEFRMPSLGADMEAGTIVEWRVQPGDTVHRGDIVAVVDTEKSDIDVEVFEDGVVEELLVAPGIEVPVGTVLARIAADAPAATAPPPPPALAPPGPEAAGFVRASPRARREAAERGVDLGALAGSGPGGAVVATDLDGTAPPAAPSPPPATPPADDRQASMRHAIGSLMARSKREIPHYYLATTIDFGPAAAWLLERNAARSVTDRVLPAALLLKATALAAREVPVMNGHFADGFVPAGTVHLGVAVALRGGGLVAPAIHDADGLTLDELMARLRDLVQRARAGGLRSSEMSDPTITVTNLGDQGVEEVFGVIYPPQVAMVGFGKVAERPWAVDGLLGVRPVVRASVAADHRASDGHDGARFLSTIDRLLRQPGAL
jgi:pyruvate dehydrogenase E2 component (dihydrolipoamide acetyltransferase)